MADLRRKSLSLLLGKIVPYRDRPFLLPFSPEYFGCWRKHRRMHFLLYLFLNTSCLARLSAFDKMLNAACIKLACLGKESREEE